MTTSLPWGAQSQRRGRRRAVGAHEFRFARKLLERRIEHVAPGEEAFSSVPQIFHDGCYIGGFSDLCELLRLAPRVASLLLAVRIHATAATRRPRCHPRACAGQDGRC